MTSFPIIPFARADRSSRRVDFAEIARLFADDDDQAPQAPPSSRVVQAASALRAFLVPVRDTIRLLREEDRARRYANGRSAGLFSA